MPHYYCIVDTNGLLDSTNMQLFSLEKAAESWNDLVEEMKERPQRNLVEMRAFVLSCLGLSLSQLLGQNCPSSDKESVAEPGDLLSSVLARACDDRTTRRRLQHKFADFLRYYGAVRHFGQSKGDAKHATVSRLTFPMLKGFRDMTIEIWDLVIAMHSRSTQNNIVVWGSIAEAVGFQDYQGDDATTPTS